MTEIYNKNRVYKLTSRGAGGLVISGKSSWSRTGHCRRCDNGGFHTDRRRGAGGESPSGVSLGEGRIRNQYTDEIAPGEKPMLRRKVRRMTARETQRVIAEETT